MSFTQFKFNPKIAANIKACKYTTPTPIQEQAIPVVLEGHDVLGLAQTGTGKTAAFVLPILHKIMKGPRRKTSALVIAPTRELAEQIHADIGKMAQQTGIHSVAVYGGVSKYSQLKNIRNGVEIIVACPGRLLDHLSDGTIDLAKVETLVLDEADHMFDMGFLPAIKRILKYLPQQRQNLFFSATMPSEIRKLASNILNDPKTIQIDHKLPKDTVSHLLYSVEQNKKTALLKNIIAKTDMGATLIFTRTKYRAKNLAEQLTKAGHNATSLHGNLSQQKRQQALNGFKEGKFKLMVATDIAARGIDVSGISHVINFDVPDTVEAYTHRIGRTGRAMCKGEAFTFAGREDGKIIKMIENTFGKKMARLDQFSTDEQRPEKIGQSSTLKEDVARQAPKRKIQLQQHEDEDRLSSHNPKFKKTGSGHKRRPRAAKHSSTSGNIFLSPSRPKVNQARSNAN